MSKIRAHSLVIAVAGILASLTGAAIAQDKPAAAPAAGAPAGAAAGAQRAPWIVACEADMKKHCEAEMKANTDVRPCLAKKDEQLSQACQDTFLRGYKVLELCKEDIDKHCKGAEGRGLGQCFNDNAAKLSDKCKGALRKGSKQAKVEAKAEATADKTAAAAEKTEAKAEKAAVKAKKKAAKE